MDTVTVIIQTKRKSGIAFLNKELKKISFYENLNVS